MSMKRWNVWAVTGVTEWAVVQAAWQIHELSVHCSLLYPTAPGVVTVKSPGSGKGCWLAVEEPSLTHIYPSGKRKRGEGGERKKIWEKWNRTCREKELSLFLNTHNYSAHKNLCMTMTRYSWGSKSSVLYNHRQCSSRKFQLFWGITWCLYNPYPWLMDI